LVIGICDLGFVWNLLFVIWNFAHARTVRACY
jgi:hypothetical protein